MKKCHICIIKLKIRVFRGLDSSDPIMRQSQKWPLKLKSFHEKLLVTKQSRYSRETLCMKLRNFQILPKNISWEDLVAKYSQGSSETLSMKMWLFNFPQAHFAGSYKSWASRETTSEPIFEEKHKNTFWTKTKNTKV